MADLAIGQMVELASGALAIIKYIGQPHFAPGQWVGVEILQGGEGKNDGSVQGERYFDCKAGQGMFLRPTAMSLTDRRPTAPQGINGAAKKGPRPSSVLSSGTGRRISSVPDPAISKRMSMNSASPTPASRSSMLRVCMLVK